MMNQMMSYEKEMINYAIRLSRQEMAREERDSACSQSREEDDVSLKMARDLQEREIKRAAKSCKHEKLLRSYIYESESAPVTDGYNANCYQDSGNMGEDYNCVREWPAAGADRHGACSTKACKCSMHDDCIKESCSLDNDEIDDGIDKNESCSRIDFAGSQDQYNYMPVKDEEGNMKNGFIEQHSPQELHQTPLFSETGEDEHKYKEVQQYEGKKKLSKHQWRKLREEEDLNMAYALSLSLQEHKQKSDPSHS
nr:uncharacterized protein LOC123770517 [Procambarus clarkii]XP_045618432.1 uncharacterized protein LOC123770517 [Procambarus clarkii]XP_045618433.1 uncharacterized protein LOC123770517 [Procambarus clarkii]